MKALLSVLFIGICLTGLGGGITRLQLNDVTYTNINRVYAGANGKIIISFDGGGTSVNVDKLPADFLASWKINLAGAKAAAANTAENTLDRAIQAGCFREIDGVVYDIRQPQNGWVRFTNVKVIQVMDSAAIVDTTPNDLYNSVPIHVTHLSSSVGDTDYITFTALLSGSYSYINKKGDDRTIREYDLGHICSRSEIPEDVLSGKATSGLAGLPAGSMVDVVATLPESHDLAATGSGFFVSEDGYLITNYHVVKNAHRVKIKTDGQVHEATVVRSDDVADLALLKVEGKFPALALSVDDPQLGDAVFTIGFPDIKLQGTQPKYTDGKISSLMGLKDDPDQFQISVPVQPGNSGGPLVDTHGNVDGVIVARLNDFAALSSMGSLPQNVNYAVKGKLLRGFIDKGGEFKAVSPKQAGTASAVATVQQSVAIVLVY